MKNDSKTETTAGDVALKARTGNASPAENLPDLQPGDILLYGGRDLVSRLIQ